MCDLGFMQSRKYTEQQWRAKREGAHPDLLEFERLLVKRLAKLGVPVFASEVWRDKSRQAELYVKGFTKAPPGKSPHQHGMAVDIVHSTKGWELTPRQWQLIGHLGKELAASKGIKITWGGDFKSLYDPAHWELANWKELANVT